MTLYHAIVIVLALSELRWRAVWLRVLLVGVTLLGVHSATGLADARRRALANPRIVAWPTTGRQANGYESGIIVMENEARRSVTAVGFPVGVLAWLALYPALLPVITRRRKRVPLGDKTVA